MVRHHLFVILVTKSMSHFCACSHLRPPFPAPIITLPFPRPFGNTSLRFFNAGCESAAEKNLFRKGLQHRRIVVAATAFYEWDQQKTKYVHLSCHLEQKAAKFMLT
ncbi:SOS response-associated peptidase family protein [uncultured Acetatifactor sp.]|uniref:SOS response-associated peptidase family protein n=1 Tax=uncultured Acetatifactor sp. TaxID=1671927 RepID=UPI0034DCE350